MKKLSKIICLFLAVPLLMLASCSAQKKSTVTEVPKLENTLLWKISGNGIEKPSYLFGTIHMICGDDAVLSDSMKAVIKNTSETYFEVDMDNMMEMLGAMKYITMKGDTTLADLLSKEDYEKVKNYFKEKGGMLPFSMLETYKPFLASAMLMESAMPCKNSQAMETIIMTEAKKNKKKINGMETLKYQMSIFDSIPYKTQADLLVKLIDKGDNNEDAKEFEEMMQAYRDQDLEKVESITSAGDMGIANFKELLLTNRNHNWVKKMQEMLPKKSVLIAVGAGHLPGSDGVINLLRKAGFTVSPVDNKVKLKTEVI